MDPRGPAVQEVRWNGGIIVFGKEPGFLKQNTAYEDIGGDEPQRIINGGQNGQGNPNRSDCGGQLATPKGKRICFAIPHDAKRAPPRQTGVLFTEKLFKRLRTVLFRPLLQEGFGVGGKLAEVETMLTQGMMVCETARSWSTESAEKKKSSI